MKKNVKFCYLTLAVLGAFAVSSCEKRKTNAKESEFQFDTNSQIVYSNIQNLNIASLRGDSGCEEILVFETMDDFKHTMNELERQCEAYDDAFVAHFDDLDEEELYDKEQELNYSEFKPNTDFESYFGFASSNADYLVAEAQYLEQGDLNEADDPDNHFIGEPEERSLLNACNEVMINDTIYKLNENGYFEISDGDFGKLALLDAFGEDLPENVRFVGGENSSSMRESTCKQKKIKNNRKNNSSNSRRIMWWLKKSNNPWLSYFTAKTKNFKKINGKWKKYRTKAKAGVEGHAYIYCEGEVGTEYTYEEKYKKRRTVRKKILVADYNHYIKPGEVKGYHNGAGGIEHNSTLVW